MPRGVFIIVSLAYITGCKEGNPAYCGLPENTGRPECMEPTTGGSCQSSADCASNVGFPVCDLMENGGTCVQCTTIDHALCTGLTPRCENQTCVPCVDGNDCGAMGVCMQDGSCADPNRIIHAQANSGIDAGTCGDVGTECTLARALAVVTAQKDIIKLDDADIYASPPGGFRVEAITPLTIDAHGATLRRFDDGPVLSISDDCLVTLLGGTVSNARGGSGHGIECSGATLIIDGTMIIDNEESAIVADRCTTRIRKASISNNSARLGTRSPAISIRSGSLTMWLSELFLNKGGGVQVTNDGSFAIVGNLFHKNGDKGATSSSVSGLILDSTTTPMNRLEFNTIVDNQAGTALAQGILCNTVGLTARNNIIWSTEAMSDPLITGSCKHAYSDIGELLPTSIDVVGNMNSDPLFEADFRVRSGSPIEGKADPLSNLTGIASVDLAGQPRMAPADIGAYQVPMQ